MTAVLLSLMAGSFGPQPEVHCYRLIPGDSSRFLLTVRVPASGLTFKREGDRYTARYELRYKFRGGGQADYSNYESFYEETDGAPADGLVFVRYLYVDRPAAARLEVSYSLVDVNSRSALIEGKVAIEGAQPTDELDVGDPVPQGEERPLATLRLNDAATLRTESWVRVAQDGEVTVEWELWVDSQKFPVMNDSRTTRAEKGLKRFYVELPVAALPPGRYTLLLHTEKGGKRVTRSLGFDTYSLAGMLHLYFKAVVDLLSYVYPGETGELAKAEPSAREVAWKAFWKEKDPTPGSDDNPLEETFMERLPLVLEQFLNRFGYISDMGKVYGKHGPPDHVESHPFEPERKPYEIWYYADISRAFVFVDKRGFGEYELIPTAYYDDMGGY